MAFELYVERFEDTFGLSGEVFSGISGMFLGFRGKSEIFWTFRGFSFVNQKTGIWGRIPQEVR